MVQYDPETFDFRHDNPRLDLTSEMDRYDQLPTEIKVKRLEAAWSHSDQSGSAAVQSEIGC
jgi:FKBP12-rapamycin complex-associated protein